MKSRVEIMFDYRLAIAQARRLDEVAAKLENVVYRDMESTIETLRSSWQSDSSSQFIAKTERVREKLGQDATKIRKVAASIRNTAEAIKNAELKSLEIAKQRTYR